MAKPQRMMILCNLIHRCTLEYQTAYKALKLAQPYTSTAVIYIIHMSEAVIIDKHCNILLLNDLMYILLIIIVPKLGFECL